MLSLPPAREIRARVCFQKSSNKSRTKGEMLGLRGWSLRESRAFTLEGIFAQRGDARVAVELRKRAKCENSDERNPHLAKHPSQAAWSGTACLLRTGQLFTRACAPLNLQNHSGSCSHCRPEELPNNGVSQGLEPLHRQLGMGTLGDTVTRVAAPPPGPLSVPTAQGHRLLRKCLLPCCF